MLHQNAVANFPVPVLLRQFVLIYLFAATVLTIAIFSSVRLDAEDRIDRTKVREAARVDIAKNLVAQDFSSVTSDLRLLASNPILHHYLNEGSAKSRAELADLFLAMAKATDRYDQVRYLDASGREIVRVNFNAGSPSIVPHKQLQDKSGRYFFRDSIRLNPDEVYVSPMDLNIEHDQLEIPHKPMIRFGTPVFDSTGRKRGIILLNYLGEELLRHFRDAMHGGDLRNAMLLNREGYWLSSGKRDDEWGFMLGKPANTFGQDFPAEWRTISGSDSGTLKAVAGLFVYSTVYPLLPGQRSSSGSHLPRAPSQHELTESEYNWKIVTFTPDAVLTGNSEPNKAGRIVMYGVAYVLLALGSLAIAFFRLSRGLARIRVQEEEARLREITVTMSDGLLVTDASGHITFANPEACRLLGYEESELIGADMHELLHVDGSKDECDMLRVARTGKTYRGVEETFRCKNGQHLPISVSASAIYRDEGAAGIVAAFHDITERKRFQQELERQAQIDALTGLNNRRHFYELAEREILRTRRFGNPLAVVMLDVDHFKNINDTYGHHIGDAVLQKLSAVCLQTMREIDLVGRIGGEEFAILLPQTTTAQAQEIAERLRAEVAATQMPLEQGGFFSCTVSIGVTGFAPTDVDLESAFKRADAAMYSAKKSGRNRVCVQE